MRIFIASILAAACASGNPGGPAPDLRLFFSEPGMRQPRRSPEDGLVALIDSARRSFYGAFYEISSQRIARRLIAARGRGVDVRLVVESDNLRGGVMQKLREAGIPIVGDESPGLMHHKFALVDGEIVWTGSYNATDNGARLNDNNAVAVRSRELAGMFLEEFRDMFEERLFGPRRRGRPFSRPALRRSVTVGGATIRALFSPRDRVEERIVRLLGRAERSVHFMAFAITSNRIGDELAALARRGVAVAGVVERRGSMTAHSEYMKLRVEGIDVRRRGGPGRMHHKVIIIDGRIVVMGSFNYTAGADRTNDENILVIESSDVAGEYLREFDRVRRAASSG